MSSGLKITKTREHPGINEPGITDPDYSGPPALLITGISKEVYDLIGEEVMWVDDCDLRVALWREVKGPSFPITVVATDGGEVGNED